jgi:energy-coupling factor transporter ATP-binding protein EcfA2
MEPDSSPTLVDVAERLGRVAAAPLLDEALRDAASTRLRQLRDNLSSHILPRARSLDAPLLVLLFGPTGAGKSSLLNALAGFRASEVGVTRPTTRDVVVVAGPDAAGAIGAAGAPLSTIAGGRLRVVESPSLAAGVALADSPDVDSIEHANRELTDRLAEAADLGIYVTTAVRYADRAPWEVLERVRDRGLPLLVVLNRMPADATDRAIVLEDVARLLGERGVAPEDLEIVSINEGAVDPGIDGLDRRSVESITARVEALGADAEARRALAVRALTGSLAGMIPLVERVADDAEHQAIEAEALRRSADHAFESELSALSERLRSGTFLREEALRQWQAFVGADEITRLFSKGIGKVRGTISALIRGTPRAPVSAVREDTLGDLVALASSHAGEAARRTATSWNEHPATRDLVARDASLWGTSPHFGARLHERLEAWVAAIADDVRATGGPKSRLARIASVGVNGTGIAVMLATFAHTGGLTGAEVGIAAATGVLNQKLLEALFGEAALVEMIQRGRTGLADALTAAFDSEVERYEALVPSGQELRGLAAELRVLANEVQSLQPRLSIGPSRPS